MHFSWLQLLRIRSIACAFNYNGRKHDLPRIPILTDAVKTSIGFVISEVRKILMMLGIFRSPKITTIPPTVERTTEPTTRKPVTAEPTTRKPVTAEPTTRKPVTANPINTEPKTSDPEQLDSTIEEMIIVVLS